MNSLRFFHLIHILIFAMSSVQGSEKHMICKQVEDVFAPSQELDPASIRSGMQGIPVVEGLCDLETTTIVRLDVMIHDFNETLASLPKMIQNQTGNDIEDKFEKMTNAFNEALASLPEKVLERKGLCEFKINDKCYWAVCHGERDMNYTESQQRCEFNGGKVATISNETDYDAIMVYLRTKICYTNTYADFWLSMIINPSTKVVTLPDRRQTSYLERQWYPGYPSTHAVYTKMVVQVKIDPSNRNQGMFNYRPDYKRNGVICEI